MRDAGVRGGPLLGDGERGQVGQGVATDAPVPTRVEGLSPIARVGSGLSHTCAVARTGEVWCWGRNAYGQIDDGTGATPRDVWPPVQLDEPPARDVAVGTRHTCVVRETGEVACRGSALEAQFADAMVVGFGPATIPGIGRAVEVRAHDKATCARDEAGDVSCWGGLVGHSGASRIYRRTPVRLAIDAVSVDVGRGDPLGLGEECAALVDGSVVCWPRSFLDGPIGEPIPMPVEGIADAVEVTVGHGFACARLASGAVACWGRNFAGQLGDGTREDSTTPRRVVGLDDATAIAAGADHACAARSSGGLVCWGRNGRGQLGVDSDRDDSPEPVPLVLP